MAQPANVDLRARIVSALDVILRVPALFAMDAILNSSGQSAPATSALWSHFSGNDGAESESSLLSRFVGCANDASAMPQLRQHSSSATSAASFESTFAATVAARANGSLTEEDDLWTVTWDSSSFGNLMLRFLGFSLALIVFFLPTRGLLLTYKWLTSLTVLYAAYWANQAFLRATDPLNSTDAVADRNYATVCLHFALQGVLALAFCLSYTGPRGPLAQSSSVAIFVFPSLLSLRPPGGTTPDWWLPWRRQLPVWAAAVGLVYVTWGTIGLARLALRHLRASRLLHDHHHAGLQWVLENEWHRLRVPHVLRLFWLVRLSEHAVMHVLCAGAGEEDGAALSNVVAAATITATTTTTLDSTGNWIMLDGLADTGKQLLVSGCDTVVAVLGMTSVVSSLAHHLSRAVHNFLMMSDDVVDEEKSFGTVSAILFFILALQTGLTGLDPEKRLVRLYRNFCLLFTAILHFVHNMVQPLLLSLSAQRGRPLQQHGRALLVCGFLVAFPAWFLIHLWRVHPVSTWLLAVSAFSVEVTVKVFVSLMVYALFVADARRQAFWERLDDYVYYVRAVGSSVEFAFGVFLFFNGAWILLFESGGSIRACMMCVHAYFNIYVQARAGWRTFARRRDAVRRIDALPEASAEQLQLLDDVCAICYQEMVAARVTRCKHYFHALCLRKWLYIQDCCPMCHKLLYAPDVAASGGGVVEDAVVAVEPVAGAANDDEW